MNESTLRKKLGREGYPETISSFLNPDSIRELTIEREDEYPILTICEECVFKCKNYGVRGLLTFVCRDFCDDNKKEVLDEQRFTNPR